MSIFDIFKKKSDNSLKATVLSLGKNEIVMEVNEDTEIILANSSKIGGKPWLPPDFKWPVFTSKEEGITRPLSFLCQIDVSNIKKFNDDGLLPDRGMLYFFYECESFRWGFDPDDKGCARVFYFENTADFVSAELPRGISEEYEVPEMAVRFSERKSYPKYEELKIHSDIDCRWDDYDELLEEMGIDTEAECHKLLGYADIIQDEILSECERTSRGIYCGDAESYRNLSEEEKASIKLGAKDWILLLQLSTLEHEDWELMWGDCGMLYFYIRKQDLADKRFENAWFSLQCG